jgi:hypothetical protein
MEEGSYIEIKTAITHNEHMNQAATLERPVIGM